MLIIIKIRKASFSNCWAVRIAAHIPCAATKCPAPCSAFHMRDLVYILPCKSGNKICNLLSTCAMLDTCVRVTHVSFLLLRASMQRKQHWPQSASRKQIYKTRWLSQGHYILRGSAGLDSPQFEISMCRYYRCKYKSETEQADVWQNVQNSDS